MAEGEVRVDYGVNLAKEMAELVALKVEPYGISKIEELENEQINKNLALIDIVSELKAAIVKATSNRSDSINFIEDGELKAAYARFVETFPDAAGFVPEDGILHAESIPDVQRLLDGQVRRPTTVIEYTMILVGRLINDQQAINDSGREILKDYVEAVRFWIKNSGAK